VLFIGSFLIQQRADPILTRAGCTLLWVCPGIIVLGILSFFLRTD
jgi:hypothetical protein